MITPMFQIMATYGEAQARIESLRQQLGIQPISFDDAQSKIVELNNQLAMMPMSRRSMRRNEQQKPVCHLVKKPPLLVKVLRMDSV